MDLGNVMNDSLTMAQWNQEVAKSNFDNARSKRDKKEQKDLAVDQSNAPAREENKTRHNPKAEQNWGVLQDHQHPIHREQHFFEAR